MRIPGKKSGASSEKNRKRVIHLPRREVDMQYTEGQKTEFRKSFAARRRRQLMVSVPMFPLIFGVILLEKRGQAADIGVEAGSLVIFLFLAIAGAIAFSLWNWRCPACRRHLGKQMNPRFCSGCGVGLHQAVGAPTAG